MISTHAIAAFAAEADKQFEPDGCHLERAIVYHRLCTDMVALAAAFAARQSGSGAGSHAENPANAR